MLEVTAVGDPTVNGIMIFLSPDMLTDLEAAMDRSCATELDSACYDAVMDVLQGSGEVTIESRDTKSHNTSQQLVSRQMVFLGAGAIGLAGLLFPLFYEGDQHLVPQPLVIPPSQVEDALAFETATSIMVFVENDVPTMTITEAPAQTAPTG